MAIDAAMSAMDPDHDLLEAKKLQFFPVVQLRVKQSLWYPYIRGNLITAKAFEEYSSGLMKDKGEDFLHIRLPANGPATKLIANLEEAKEEGICLHLPGRFICSSIQSTDSKLAYETKIEPLEGGMPGPAEHMMVIPSRGMTSAGLSPTHLLRFRD